MHQIEEERKEAQRKADKKFNRMITTLVMLGMLTLISSVWSNYYFKDRGEPAPAVVNLQIVPRETNPVLCPGDFLHYSIISNTEQAGVVEVDWTVQNLDTGRTEIQSETVRDIRTEDEIGSRTVFVGWMIPKMLPPTNTRPERPWTPGRYRREIAITGIEGEKKASVVFTDFRIGTDCS